MNPVSNAIRILTMDAVQQANSGHPGAPMGMAEMAQALWTKHLRHNPLNPSWYDRDRFILSNGHASMLMYALLHLTGYDLSIEDLKAFRQLHSKTPGHPEVGITAGVETTTGPLGQGISNAVGFALAERLLAAEFNRPGHTLVDHFTYVFAGDGCLMEGISHEVCSLAGTLKLSRLIVLYDDNGISIDGKVADWFADDTPKRFEAYGWQVIRNVDGHDVDALDRAIAQAKAYAADENAGPTLICCRTVIGKGSPNKSGSAKVHGSPLGGEEIVLTREAMGWANTEPFKVPESVYQAWSQVDRGTQLEREWQVSFSRYREMYPELAAEFERRMRGELPADFTKHCQAILAETVKKAENLATRAASQVAITELVKVLPEMLGGSADLTGSNLTDWKGVEAVRAGKFGRHINYGVREFGMVAIMNGVALHGGYLPFGGTFLTFSDYSRNAIRMSALMKQRVVNVFTHDSIGLGEDGPTHQSIEHAASLRLIPNLDVWRPCDTVETFVAWQSSVARPQSMGMDMREGGPSALLLSRQKLPFVQRDEQTIANIYRGGYVLRSVAAPQVVLIATGSEVEIALNAQERLAAEGIQAQVVSMPCTSIFDRQDSAYRQSVLPANLPKVAIEAGVTDFWYKYVGLEGAVLGIDRYGESAPAADLFEYFGLTAQNLADKAKALIAN